MSLFFTGLFLGGSLIIAIGSQNIYALKQGLLHNPVFIICLICSLSDALLILLGTSGVGARLLTPLFKNTTSWISNMVDCLSAYY